MAGQGPGLFAPSGQDLAIPLASLSLAGRLYAPSGQARATAIMAHGLFSSMQSEKLNRLAQALAGDGYLALMYDAWGCGASPGQVRETTLTSRREEFLAAAKTAQRLEPGLPLFFLGSSLGGCAALTAAGVIPPARLALWSTPLDMEALLRGMAAKPDPPDLPLMAADLPRHDLPALLAATPGILFVHGHEDQVVPARHATWGHGLAAAPKDLFILPGADHRLSRREDQEAATARTLAWLRGAMGESSISVGG